MFGLVTQYVSGGAQGEKRLACRHDTGVMQSTLLSCVDRIVTLVNPRAFGKQGQKGRGVTEGKRSVGRDDRTAMKAGHRAALENSCSFRSVKCHVAWRHLIPSELNLTSASPRERRADGPETTESEGKKRPFVPNGSISIVR